MKNALDFFLVSVFALFVSVLIYGALRYPDVPIRPCGASQFCGKWNRLHTEEEYKEFVTWEKALVISFPLGLTAGVILRRRRRPRVSQDWEHLRIVQRNLSPKMEAPRYAAAWKDLRRRELAAQVSFAALFVVLFAGWAIPTSGGFLAVPLLLALSVFAAGSNVWHDVFRCPRCGDSFVRRQPRDRCPHCSLRRETTFEQSLVEIERGDHE